MNPINFYLNPPVLSSQNIGWKGLMFQEVHHPSHEILEHVMPHHMILIINTQGNFQESRIGGKFHSRMRNKDELLIVPAGETNATAWTGNAEFSRLTLCPQFMKDIAHELVDPDRIEIMPKFVTHDPLIHQISLSLKADLEIGSPTGKIFGESAAIMLAARLLQQHSIRSPKQLSDQVGLSSYALRLVVDHIRSHLNEDLMIADLAQIAGMSSYYFMRMFKRSMHITVRQYIIQQRVELAQELLRRRELSIADIALQCGFTNQSHFTNVFRQLAKTTPKTYRKDFG